jgi:5-formyltetrahydrofolate cyclo-ligase
MHMVEIKDLQDLHALPKNSWGIPEPSMDEKRMDSFMAGGLDLIIMPGLAFDRKGNRIGYGKGYYDRFLSKCYINSEQYAITRPFTIAIALQCQLVEEVPTEVTDLKPDEIICA